jgi:hypothetical protein
MSQIRELIDEIDNQLMKKNYESSKEVINLVGKFVKDKELILYGGFALNILLPKKSQFYKEYTINDYDCFSSNAKEDANELATLLQKSGYKYIKVRKALHDSTFKVFVEFVPVLDITQIAKHQYENFLKISKAERKSQIYKHYKEDYVISPYSFLMSNMHFELSRPLSSYYRWEKIYRRQSVFAKLINPHKALKNKITNDNKDKKIEKTIIDYIKKNNMIIVNEYALKYHGIKDVDSDNVAILSKEIEKTKKEFDQYLKTNFGNYKIITEQDMFSTELMYHNYHITIINKENKKRFMITIIDASRDCLSIVTKRNIHIGSLNTVMFFLYRKYLLQQIAGNPNKQLWDIIKYVENHVQEKMKLNPKQLLSTSCYGVNHSLQEVLVNKWKQKQTLKYY